MKSQSKEFGSVVHIVVIIVLIVAVLGLLGFVFWNNFSKKPAASTQTTSSTTADTTSLATLKVNELGVGVLYDSSLPTASYSYTAASDGVAAYANITSKSLIGTNCTGDNGSIAQIIKNPTSADNFSESPIVATATIDTNKYVLTLSGSNCASDTALLTKYQTSIEHNFIKLVAE